MSEKMNTITDYNAYLDGDNIEITGKTLADLTFERGLGESEYLIIKSGTNSIKIDNYNKEYPLKINGESVNYDTIKGKTDNVIIEYSGKTAGDLTFRRNGIDLVINYGTGTKTITGYFTEFRDKSGVVVTSDYPEGRDFSNVDLSVVLLSGDTFSPSAFKDNISGNGIVKVADLDNNDVMLFDSETTYTLTQDGLEITAGTQKITVKGYNFATDGDLPVYVGGTKDVLSTKVLNVEGVSAYDGSQTAFKSLKVTGTNANDSYTGGNGDDVFSIVGGGTNADAPNDVVTPGKGNDSIHVAQTGNVRVNLAKDAADDSDTIYGVNNSQHLTIDVGTDVTSIYAYYNDEHVFVIERRYGDNSKEYTVLDNYTYNKDNTKVTVIWGDSSKDLNYYYVSAPIENTDGDGNYNNNDGNDHYVVGGDDSTTGDNININGNGNNTVNGGAGDDQISITGNGDNSIIGGDGSDIIIVNGDGNNTIEGGGSGNNQITASGAGYYTIYGGEGDDVIDGSGASMTAIFGLDGDDVIKTGQSVDTTGGGKGNVTDGGAGDDTITAQGLNNLIDGGIGDDSITFNSDVTTNSGTIYGGYGADEISLESDVDEYGIVVPMYFNGTIYGGEYPGEESDYTGADDASNVITAEVIGNVEVHAGNMGDNIRVGYLDDEKVLHGENTVYGGAGDDEINALGSSRATIYGGDGADMIYGSYTGNSSIEAGAGKDIIAVHGGNNYVDAGDGDDQINSIDQEKVPVYSTEGSIIIGGKGSDVLSFGGSIASGVQETFVFRKGDGNDILVTPSGDVAADTLRFTDCTWNELYMTISTDNVMTISYGEQGNLSTITIGDAINPYNELNSIRWVEYLNNNGVLERISMKAFIEQKNKIDLGPDEHGYDGTNFAESITGTEQDDTIFGSGGNDRIYGLGGADDIKGGAGNDQLYGGYGDDILTGGEGNDVLNGGGGSNTLNVDAGDDMVISGGGYDTIVISGGEPEKASRSGNDLIISTILEEKSSSAPSVTLKDYFLNVDGYSAEKIKFTDTEVPMNITDLSLYQEGSGTISGARQFDETIVGSDGNDVITNVGGGHDENVVNDFVTPGKGNDRIEVEDGGKVSILLAAGDGNDSISGAAASTNTILDFSGDDEVTYYVKGYQNNNNNYVIQRFWKNGESTYSDKITLENFLFADAGKITILNKGETVSSNAYNIDDVRVAGRELALAIDGAYTGSSTDTTSNNYILGDVGGVRKDTITAYGATNVIRGHGGADIIHAYGITSNDIVTEGDYGYVYAYRGTNTISASGIQSHIEIYNDANATISIDSTNFITLNSTGITTVNASGIGNDYTVKNGQNTINSAGNDNVKLQGGTNEFNSVGSDAISITGGQNTINLANDTTKAASVSVNVTSASTNIINDSDASNSYKLQAGNNTLNLHKGEGYDNDNVTIQGGVNIINGTNYIEDITIHGGENTMNLAGGDDVINVNGASTNTLNLGAGADVVNINVANSTNTLNLGAGADDVNINVANSTNVIDFGDDNDSVSINYNSTSTIWGGNGADTIIAKDGNNTIYGGVKPSEGDYTGADTGKNIIKLGAGSHTVYLGNQGDTVTTVEDGISTYGSAIITGGAGDDSINVGDLASAVINAGAGDDVIIGSNTANTIPGGDNDDDITGGAGNDSLYGDAGNDILSGLSGNDSMYGGAGGDTYYTKLSNNSYIEDDSSLGDNNILTLSGEGEEAYVVMTTGDAPEIYLVNAANYADWLDNYGSFSEGHGGVKLSATSALKTITDSAGRVMNNITSSYGEEDYSCKLQAMQEAIAGWLADEEHPYDSVADALASADKEALIAVFDSYKSDLWQQQAT